MASDHHGVISGVETAYRVAPRSILGQGDELIPFPGLEKTHGLETIGYTYIHATGGDRFPGFLEAQPACCATTLHAMAWHRAQAQIILGYDGGHKLARKVVGKACSHGAVNNGVESGEVKPQIGNGIIKCLFDDGLKSFVGAGLRKS